MEARKEHCLRAAETPQRLRGENDRRQTKSCLRPQIAANTTDASLPALTRQTIGKDAALRLARALKFTRRNQLQIEPYRRAYLVDSAQRAEHPPAEGMAPSAAARCAWPAAGVLGAVMRVHERRRSPAEASAGADVTTRDVFAALRRDRFVVVEVEPRAKPANAPASGATSRHEDAAGRRLVADRPPTWIGGDDNSPALRLIGRLRGVAMSLTDDARRRLRRSVALSLLSPLGQLARYGGHGALRAAPRRQRSARARLTACVEMRILRRVRRPPRHQRDAWMAWRCRFRRRMHPTPSFRAAVLYLCGPAWDEPARSGDDGAWWRGDAADDEGDSATAVHRVRPVGGRSYSTEDGGRSDRARPTLDHRLRGQARKACDE